MTVEDETSLWFYQEVNIVHGPHSLDKMHHLLRSGTINNDTMVRESGKNWLPLSGYPSLKELLDGVQESKLPASEVTLPESAVVPISSSAKIWPFNRIYFAIVFGIFSLFSLVYFAYVGFPSIDTLLHYWLDAEKKCVDFANKNKNQLFFGKSNIKAMSSWLKNGHAVVEVGGFNEGEDIYTPRICVIAKGQIQIVSVFENAAWR